MRSLLKVVVLLALAAAFLGLWFWHDYQSALRDPLAIGEEAALYTVEPGANFSGVARDIRTRGWWNHAARYFVLHVRARAMANKLKNGEYRIEPAMSIDQLIDLLVSGKTVQHAVTIVEGWTFAQVRQALEQSPVLEQTLRGLDDAAVMERLGHPGIHPEGRFFPDTYYVTRGTTDAELLKRAYTSMDELLSKLWAQRTGDQPYTNADEALIMASIVEKETAVPAERPLIASVFVQRLKRGMKLQTDPTVIYGLGSTFDGNLRHKDLANDTPYNTYTRSGLPPTPISIPGKESIVAALQPADSEALYFVARGDGSHEFSGTLEEHNRAVARYQSGGGAAQIKKP